LSLAQAGLRVWPFVWLGPLLLRLSNLNKLEQAETSHSIGI
jgi:hypothetical protein